MQDETDYRELQVPGQAWLYGKDLIGNDALLHQTLAGARQLFDHDVCSFPGRPIMTHLCEVCDLQTKLYLNGSAMLAPVWRYLIANESPVSKAAFENNVTCAG